MEPIVAVAMQCEKDAATYVLHSEYIDFLEQAGLEVLPVAPTITREGFLALLKEVEGFVIPGGNDINPILYGENPIANLDEPVPERDEFELMALPLAIKRGLPCLGICRGMQILNVAFGGTLHQNLAFDSIDHWPDGDGHRAAHRISLAKGSLLGKIFSNDKRRRELLEIEVNSLHHQAVAQIGRGLRIEAISDDGIVEALSCPDAPFALGVQWHPEMMLSTRMSKCLGKAFAQACASYRRI